ncbi:MAG: hypothetical protein SynsKO_10080 [Synoicihabitans sp.]
MNIMKTSLILFSVATVVPFFMLLGLSGIAAFSIMTALSIVAMISLDYDHGRDVAYNVKSVSPVAASRATKAASETHPYAA